MKKLFHFTREDRQTWWRCMLPASSRCCASLLFRRSARRSPDHNAVVGIVTPIVNDRPQE